MKKIVVKRNETIFESGAKADSVYLIVSGEIGIFLPTNNSDKPDFILGENEIFGEMGVIDKSLRAGRADDRLRGRRLPVPPDDPHHRQPGAGRRRQRMAAQPVQPAVADTACAGRADRRQ